MTPADVAALLADEFPQCTAEVVDVAHGRARVRQAITTAHLRPGGTVSGPTTMALADVGAYVAVLGAIGPVPLTVTTSLTISFLRKPRADRALVCDAELLKLGRRLAVADVRVRSEGEEPLVAQGTVTYAIPERRGT